MYRPTNHAKILRWQCFTRGLRRIHWSKHSKKRPGFRSKNSELCSRPMYYFIPAFLIQQLNWSLTHNWISPPPQNWNYTAMKKWRSPTCLRGGGSKWTTQTYGGHLLQHHKQPRVAIGTVLPRKHVDPCCYHVTLAHICWASISRAALQFLCRTSR